MLVAAGTVEEIGEAVVAIAADAGAGRAAVVDVAAGAEVAVVVDGTAAVMADTVAAEAGTNPPVQILTIKRS